MPVAIDTRSAHDRRFVMLTGMSMAVCHVGYMSMAVTCQCSMPIPTNALGQDAPTAFANANHFWAYENFAYHSLERQDRFN